MNTLPAFSEKTNGLWRRLRIIPFTQVIAETDKEKRGLREELEVELPGILNWAIEGLVKLKDLIQFPECAEGAAVKGQHRYRCDHEKEFLKEHTEDGSGECVPSDSLYRTYRRWMEDNGYKPCGAGKFDDAVKEAHPNAMKKRSREMERQVTVWVNIKMIP